MMVSFHVLPKMYFWDLALARSVPIPKLRDHMGRLMNTPPPAIQNQR